MVALLRIEIDRFDELSDRLGHQGIDTLQKELAARLTRNCRSTDMVARLVNNLTEQPQKILDEIKNFSEELERALKITRH